MERSLNAQGRMPVRGRATGAKRMLSLLVLGAIVLGSMPGNAWKAERRVVYAAEARSVTMMSETLARTVPVVAAAYFYMTPTRSSFTVTVDDAASVGGETFGLVISVGDHTVFDGCVPDATPRTITGARPGLEHRVFLWAGGGHTCDVNWPTVGVITVAD